jgi:hypothetical protein
MALEDDVALTPRAAPRSLEVGRDISAAVGLVQAMKRAKASLLEKPGLNDGVTKPIRCVPIGNFRKENAEESCHSFAFAVDPLSAKP